MKTVNSAKQAPALIEEGAQWLTLHMPGASADEIAAEITALIPVAQRAGIIAVLQGDPALALNTTAGNVRLSGVLIDPAEHDPAATRELLGPHAIIGVIAATPAQVLELSRLDIDYFTLPEEYSNCDSIVGLNIAFVGPRPVAAESK